MCTKRRAASSTTVVAQPLACEVQNISNRYALIFKHGWFGMGWSRVTKKSVDKASGWHRNMSNLAYVQCPNRCLLVLLQWVEFCLQRPQFYLLHTSQSRTTEVVRFRACHNQLPVFFDFSETVESFPWLFLGVLFRWSCKCLRGSKEADGYVHWRQWKWHGGMRRLELWVWLIEMLEW